jgi:predicted dehydrogenase
MWLTVERARPEGSLGADQVGVGIVGSRFMAGVHAECVQRNPNARLIAVAGRTATQTEEFARKWGIPRWFTDYRALLALPEVDLVFVTTPTHPHAEVTIEAARAKKHVVCEKPLCVSLGDADRMVDACRANGVKLMYAEEFCFAPKYVRVKEVVAEGAIGPVYQMKHVEKSYGPGNPWYWDVERSGGGCVMQLGSHSLGIINWMLDRPRATGVYAELRTLVHAEKGRGEDDSVIVVDFGGKQLGLAENSWCKRGGMDDRLEVFGTDGVIFADLYRGSAFDTYSESGYAFAAPGGAPRTGWTYTVWDEFYNNGFPQEDDHFIDCVKRDLEPRQTGDDGRAVLEIISAAYESARTARKVPLPFHSAALRAIDVWKPIA